MGKKTRIALAVAIAASLVLVIAHALCDEYRWCICPDRTSRPIMGAEEIYEPELDGLGSNCSEEDSTLANSHLRKPIELTPESSQQFLRNAYALVRCDNDSIGEAMLMKVVAQPDSALWTEEDKRIPPPGVMLYAKNSSWCKNDAYQALMHISLAKGALERADAYRILADSIQRKEFLRGNDDIMDNYTSRRTRSIILYRQKKYQEVIQNEVKDFNRGNDYRPWLVAAIQRLHTHQEICREFDQAFAGIEFTPSSKWGFLGVVPDSAKAVMTLFGEKIEMERPELRPGKKARKKDYIDRFKERYVYRDLIEDRPKCE